MIDRQTIARYCPSAGLSEVEKLSTLRRLALSLKSLELCLSRTVRTNGPLKLLQIDSTQIINIERLGRADNSLGQHVSRT